MSLPLYHPGDDPGPSFNALLRRLDGPPPQIPPGTVPPPLAHGTTIVALRYADGVVMAGDRRATVGATIAHRAMDKVHPADRYSGVAIAGAAGFALEMVKRLQLELEHYEKLTGSVLSLEGKANMLGSMVRDNLQMVFSTQFQLAVVPLFAGFDVRRRSGRIFTYDWTGGRYEETEFHADGSGGRDARTTVKLAWTEGLERVAALELAIQALYEAADEDSATGGPDAVRGIYPTVATITAEGYRETEEAEVAERFSALVERKTVRGLAP